MHRSRTPARRTAAVALLLLATGAAAGSGAVEISIRTSPIAPPAGGRYLGPGACVSCHPAQHRWWAGGRHSRAMDRLAGPSADDPVCLRCHTTGYGVAGGYGPGGGSPTLAGVTCESCHGPCGDHVETGASTVAALGECPDCLKGRVCLACHTARMDPAFDLPSALAAASCPSGP